MRMVHPKPLIHAAAVAALFGLVAESTAAPAPRTDVDWSDAGDNWLDMFVRDVSGESRPHLTLSAYLSNLTDYEIHTAFWTGAAWTRVAVKTGLSDPPYAVTGWRPASPSGNYEIVYGFYAGSPLELTWATYNVGTTTWGAENTIGEVSASAVRPSIAVRSDGDPAFAFFADDAGFGPENTYFARWETGTGVIEVNELDDCTGDWPTLLLDPNDDDTAYVSCLEDTGGGSTDVRFVFGDPSRSSFTSEVVFGGSDAHLWKYPAMALIDGVPAIAAYDSTDDEVWLRLRTGGSWQAPVQLLDNVELQHLAIDALGDGNGGGRVGVTALTDIDGIWIDYTPGGGGGVGDRRRFDLNPDSGAACEPPALATGVKLSADGENALIGWITEAQAVTSGYSQVYTARHTQFRIDDQIDWEQAPDVVPDLQTSLALDDDGDGWTCYFDESSVSPPDIDLFIKHRDDAPLVVDSDTGYGASAYARGCDVAVAPDGTIGVLWHSTVAGPADVINYRERVAGVFGSIETLADGLGVAENNGHLALTFDSSSDAHAVFARYTSGAWNPWVGHRSAGWTLDQVDTYAGGFYPDIVYLPSSYYAHVSYVLTAINSVTYAKETGGTPWIYNDLVVSKVSYDTSIDTQLVGGNQYIAVGWDDFTSGQVEYAYVDTYHTGGGAATVLVMDDSAGANDFMSVELKFDGTVMGAWRKTNPSTSAKTLRISDERPFSGGRSSPSAPVAGRITCDVRDSEAGIDLELDGYDNPRAMHRPDVQVGMSTVDGFQYMSRP